MRSVIRSHRTTVDSLIIVVRLHTFKNTTLLRSTLTKMFQLHRKVTWVLWILLWIILVWGLWDGLWDNILFVRYEGRELESPSNVTHCSEDWDTVDLSIDTEKYTVPVNITLPVDVHLTSLHDSHLSFFKMFFFLKWSLWENVGFPKWFMFKMTQSFLHDVKNKTFNRRTWSFCTHGWLTERVVVQWIHYTTARALHV